MKLLLLLLLSNLYSLVSFSQTHTITGVVFDEKETPLESANIIAKPLQEK